MKGSSKDGKTSGKEAAEVFRQFAWNLAGTLAKRPAPKGTGRRGTRP